MPKPQLGRCSICGEPAVSSHLLPKAFALHIKGDDKHTIITDLHVRKSTLSQGGLFDRNILCDRHEKALQLLDDYAVRFCLDIDRSKLPPVGETFLIHDVDQELLVGFACSVLWRCHVSARPEAREIDVGPYEHLLQRIVFERKINQAPPVYILFPVSSRFDPTLLTSLPACKRIDNVRRWGFMAGGVHFALDLGKVRSPLSVLAINGVDPIPAGVVNFDDPELYGAWREMARVWAAQERR